jgi:hypothetical protein
VRFHYHIAAEKSDPYPPIIELPTVESETAWKVVAKLAKKGSYQRPADNSGCGSCWRTMVPRRRR